MDRFELSIVINHPIEDVFGFTANLENDVKWHSAFVEVRNLSGGSLGVGSRYLVFEEPRNKWNTGAEYEVIEYKPNQVVSWKTLSGPMQLKFWRKFEQVDGGTRFDVRYEGEARGFLRFIWPLLIKVVIRMQRGDMHRLKELLETRKS